ncbi:Glycosyl transferases group 1 [Paenibacillus sp. UNC496MF]|uniref:glycosyltransferase family 4 protein n=1 Tax=Paenibacillus sp. UNC496MF TaxID=1502753 RepID=UPI0008E8C4C0|nr:glycosyltransferase [Paenibacillus sp. UNC496MF]SFI72011.1 Glycosyl transferases group 1 [Paenibacillus sp. UNC496MF]
MKILFAFFTPSGGMETLNRVRCKALRKIGAECHLLYTHDGEGLKNIWDIPTFVLRTDAEFRWLIESQRYDAVIVCTDDKMLRTMRRIGYAGPLVFELQGLGQPETAHAFMAGAAAGIRQTADALLIPRTSHLETLLATYLQGMPYFTFDNPLETEEFAYVPYPPKPFPIVGWVGRLEPNKNWREFLLIGSRILAHNPDACLWMFGDATLNVPGEKEEFDRWVGGLRLQDKVMALSNIPHAQVADYLSVIGDSGGFLCSTSVLEGFGYAVAEAMLCRCPVLTTHSDGVNRFVIHNRTGKLYPLGNIDAAFAEAKSLMTDAALRSAIRNQAEMHIRHHFSAERYTTYFMSMLNDVIVRKP